MKVHEELMSVTGFQSILSDQEFLGAIFEEVQSVTVQVVGRVRVIAAVDVHEWNDLGRKIQVVGKIPGSCDGVVVRHDSLVGEPGWTGERRDGRIV